MVRKTSNTLYNSYPSYLINLIEKISYRQRLKLYKKFCKLISFNEKDKVIDIGTTSSENFTANVFLKKYPHKNKFTCFSNQDCRYVLNKYKCVKFVIGDARKTKFSNNSFDIVYSNAVIEHVGSFQSQRKFIKELYRISSRVCFIVTPYRFHPIEFHTNLPFLHFLPKNIYRKILKILGYDFLSKEENLNLMSKNEIKKILRLSKIKKYKILNTYFLFFPSHIILVLFK